MSTEQPDQHGHQPTEEEMMAAFEEQMRRLTVPDVLVQTAVTLVNLGSQKLAEEHDLAQVQAAIEGTRALLPVLPEDVQGPVKDALSQLQIAFVRESQDPGGAAEPEQPQPEPEQTPDDEAARAEARSKIWTPPGA